MGFKTPQSGAKAQCPMMAAITYGPFAAISERTMVLQQERASMPVANGKLQAAITGVGMCAPGRGQVRPIMEVMLDAVDEALADAGLTLDDIDGIATFPLRGSYENDSPIDVT